MINLIKMKKVGIYGVGSFGFALLKHLEEKADNGTISLHAYDIDSKLRESLAKKRRHLWSNEDSKISNEIIIEDRSEDLVDGVDVLILSVISTALSFVITEIKPYINKNIIILNTAKAVNAETGERLSVEIDEILKDISFSYAIANLSGGTIAQDLFAREPLGIDLASEDENCLPILRDLFVSDNLNVYLSTDLKGVEYAGAFKNVISILAGMTSGLGFSYGSETHLISRVAFEVERLAVNELGSRQETFSMKSQCWGNDMWMSATGKTRNREFGELMGKGHKPEEILEKMKAEHKSVEGVNTIKVIKKLIAGKEEEYPILSHLYKIILKNYHPKEAILKLMRSNKI
jgi:glycerol-3-phosphate dehydrogenase (NAD(P)+)